MKVDGGREWATHFPVDAHKAKAAFNTQMTTEICFINLL
jgi:hypothetical protein